MRSLFKKNDFASQADEGASAAKPSRQLDNPLHASLRANDFPSASSSAPSTGSGQQRRPSLRSTAPPLVAATGRLALQPPDVHLALGRTPRGQSEELARESITSTVNACLGQAWEPSTQQTYNSTLSVNVGGAEIRLGAELLPMDSDSKLMAAFASMDGKPWGSTRVLKAAVRAWHESRNAQDLFSAAWTSTAFRFWPGLKKRADHTKSNAKIAVSLEEFDSFVLACVGRSNASGLRDAAAAGVCFFGIRRSAEMLALQGKDLGWLGASNSPSGASCRVTKQKNDPDGHGMTCWIPSIPQRGELCPVRLLQRWCLLRGKTWPGQEGALFCVTGKKEIRAQSYDSWRKRVAAHFASSAIGTHSLRKGGAHWFRNTAKIPDDVTQAQGGWADPKTMRAVYSALTEAERRSVILSAGLAATSAVAASTAPTLQRAESSSSSSTSSSVAFPPAPAQSAPGRPPPRKKRKAASEGISEPVIKEALPIVRRTRHSSGAATEEPVLLKRFPMTRATARPRAESDAGADSDYAPSDHSRDSADS